MIMRGLLYKMLCGLMIAVLSLAVSTPAKAQERLKDQSTPEDIEKLVRIALLQGSGNFALSEYTHVQKLKVTEADKKGIVKAKLSTVKEAFVPSRMKKGQRVRWVYVLIEKDGKPVPAADIEKARLKAGEQLAKDEAEIQKRPLAAEEQANQDKLPPPRGIYFSISTTGMFSSGTSFSVRGLMMFCTFSNPRYETVNGRQMVLLDFTPQPDAKWSGEESYKANLVGRAWFDLEEIMLAKLEGWPVGQARPDQPYVFYESLRTPDGQWLPRVIAINGDQRKDFFKRDLSNIAVEFTDYQRFGAEVKDVQMKEPVKP